MKWADVKESDIVLEAGMGTGRIVNKMVPAASTVVGLDFSSTKLTRFRKGCVGVHYVVADVSHLPFREKSFTLVICLGVTCYLPPNATGITNMRSSVLALEEFRRVLKKPGRLIVDFHNALNPLGLWHHMFNYAVLKTPQFYGVLRNSIETVLMQRFRLADSVSWDYTPIPSEIIRRLLPNFFVHWYLPFWRNLGRFLCSRSRLIASLMPYDFAYKLKALNSNTGTQAN